MVSHIYFSICAYLQERVPTRAASPKSKKIVKTKSSDVDADFS